MAKIRDWFWEWACRHVQRIPRPDWPKSQHGEEFWETYRQAFNKHGVTELTADEASRALAEAPPQFLDQHLARLIEQVKAVWKRNAALGTGAPDEREEAQRLSRDCDDCGGSGFATRYRKRSLGQARTDPHVVLYCRCPYGRWVEKNHRLHSPGIRKGFPDLEDHRFLWGEEYRRPPAETGRDGDWPAPFEEAAY